MFLRRHPVLATTMGFVLLIVIAAGIAAWRWIHPPPLPPIPYGPQTTFLEQPRHADGTMDYVRAFQERLAPIVADERNAARLLVPLIGPDDYSAEYWATLVETLELPPVTPTTPRLIDLSQHLQALGRDPQTFEQDLKQALTGTWRGEQFPVVRDWLTGLEEPLRIVERASRLPRFAMPLDLHQDLEPPLLLLTAHGLPGSRRFGEPLWARANLRMGEGDRLVPADGLTVHRLAALAWQGPGVSAVLEGCNLIAVGNDVLRTWLQRGPGESSSELRSVLAAVQVCRPPDPRAFFEYERLGALDTCMAGFRAMQRYEGNPFSIPFKASRRPPDVLLDPGSLLRTVNQYYDVAPTVAGSGEIADLTAFRDFAQGVKDAGEFDWTITGSLERVFQLPSAGNAVEIGQLLNSLVVFMHERTLTSLALARLRHHFLEVALSLELERQESGAVPGSLDSVAPRLGLPGHSWTELAQYVEYMPGDRGFRLQPSALLQELGFGEAILPTFHWTVGPEAR